MLGYWNRLDRKWWNKHVHMNTNPLTLGKHNTNGKTVTVRFHVSIYVLIHLQFEQG